MNQVQKENAIFKIHGYFLPKSTADHATEFERAKREAIENMQAAVDHVRKISLRDFFPKIKLDK